ncbi:hypothetical protein SteCoe_12188 [Stentor coeruleus]|uniref:Uncharacterized protein n=1 Tax=Stentor coeruleus TaxID=5963 RepID=A0A1R2CBF9_9CILI|nr:hypothetical protein SteCoe_12188 [Stentor coeruleus]
MEGKISAKRLSKKNFEMKLPNFKPINPINDHKSPDDLHANKTHLPSDSEEEQQNLIEPDTALPILQHKTQSDIQTDSRLLLNSNLYTTEEDSDKSPAFNHFSQPHKRSKKTNPFSELASNPALYTQEETSEEESPSKPIKKSSKTLSKKHSKVSDPENLDSQSDSQEIPLPIKRKKNYKKVSPIPLKTFNKLIDIKKDTFVETGESIDIQDEEILVTQKAKVFNCSFLDKIKNCKTEKPNHVLAKGVFTDTSIHESLEVQAPKKLVGFIVKKQQINPRDILRESLKNEINYRKTTHLHADSIFTKSSTDLPGKINKNPEDNESDYIPDDNEEKEALEMEKIIRLEEGQSSSDEDSSNTETESESTETENKESVKLDDSSKDMDIDDTPIVDIENDSLTVASETINEPLISNTLPPVFSMQTDNSPSLPIIPKPIKILNRFIDEEAELGSDHEEHDNLVKNIKDSDEENEDLDEELEEIIDRNKVDDDEEMRYGKHLDQLMKDDEERIKKVVNAEFKRQRKDLDFIDNEPSIMTKRDKLLEDKKNLLAQRGNQGVFNSFKVDKEEMDDEEFDKFKMLKSSQELKFIRNQFSSKVLIDDKSLSILSLISKPDNTITSKSMLVGGEKDLGFAGKSFKGVSSMQKIGDKGNSMRVFKSSANLSSNRSFVFSKEKTKKQTLDNVQTKKTKLFRLLSN